MANLALFGGNKLASRGRATDTTNLAGGRAYKLSNKAALAQYVATGTFAQTFYASGAEQLDEVVKLTGNVEPEFIAKCAIYGRREAHMKDAPAVLLAALSVLSPGLMAEAFDRVIDNGRMLRTFVQVMRSGLVGRRSLGTLPKRLIGDWLNRRPAEALFRDSIGTGPSLADVIKMAHPKPADEERRALFAYLLGRGHDAERLPEIVREFERFQADLAANRPGKTPDLPFTMLAGLPLAERHWRDIAEHAPWNTTRMNLNTFLRHNVFKQPGMTETVARRLADAELVRRARAFPYSLMAAYVHADKDLPRQVKAALHAAMEASVANVPALRRADGSEATVAVLPDVSGSMHSAVTGYRPGQTTAVRCIDVAALVAACVLRNNPRSLVVPFHDKACPEAGGKLSADRPVLENAKTLAALPSGGTDCSAPLRWLESVGHAPDVVIFVSDNESWIDPGRPWGGKRATATADAWAKLKRRNPRAKLVCLDVQPQATTQARSATDVLNVGGFSDAVWTVIDRFAHGDSGADHWVRVIEETSI